MIINMKDIYSWKIRLTMINWYFIFHKYHFLKDLITYDSEQNECEKWQIETLEIKNDDNEKYTFVARFSNFMLRPCATIKIFSSCLSLSSVSFSQYIHLQYIHCYYSENEKLNTNCRWLHIHQIKMKLDLGWTPFWETFSKNAANKDQTNVEMSSHLCPYKKEI